MVFVVKGEYFFLPFVIRPDFLFLYVCVSLLPLPLLFFLFFSLAHSQRLNLVISFPSRPCCLHSSVFFHAFHPLLLAHLHTMSLNFYSVLVRVSCIFLLLCLLCPPFSLLPIKKLFTTPFSLPNFLTFDCPIHFLLFISFLNFCFFLFFFLPCRGRHVQILRTKKNQIYIWILC